MAFVIVSSGSVTHSTTRTVSASVFVAVLVVIFTLMLALGFFLGRFFALQPEETVESIFLSGDQTRQVDNRLLVNRVGELSGRMIQLEAEANDLAERITAIKDFEKRTDSKELDKAKERLARTRTGGGGPYLSPQTSVNLHPSDIENVATPAVLLGEHLEWMDAGLSRIRHALRDVDRLATSLNMGHLFFPSQIPVKGRKITSGFGNRRDPFTGRKAFHSGIDYANPVGTPILASGGGKVIFSGRRHAYGNTVEIDHGGGVVTRYAHASKLRVKKGEVVRAGDVIAEIGSTGRSTGPHLHFEILKDGYFVNPKTYLARF